MAEASFSEALESMVSVLRELMQRNSSTSRRELIIQILQQSVTTLKALIWNDKVNHPAVSDLQKKTIRKLKELFYDAEDLLDYFTNTVSFPLSPTKINEIKSLKRSFEAINADIAFSLDLYNTYSSGHLYVNNGGSETYPFVAEEDIIIGLKADRIAVVDMLLMSTASKSSIHTQEQVSAVCIVGMGGVGKTTLARLVFNDPRIHTTFELRLWVWVGVDCTIKGFLNKIVAKAGVNELELEELKEQFREKIQGKRLLLVLDDVWCEDPNQWDQLINLLGIGAKGSKILVTSRSFRVAQVVGDTCNVHELKGLSKEDSCNLFYRFAFSPCQRSDAELVNMGKEVAQKCANLPLIIKVVARSLCGQERSKWLLYRNTDFTEIAEVKNRMLPILRHVYHDLNHQLKMCFEFCSIFPKDYVIEKEVLINMWLTLGILAPVHEAQNMEEIGEDYFSTLLDRFFFQDIQQDEYGNVISFKKHEFLHDLAQEQAGEEFLMLTDTNKHHLEKKIRHLSISKHASSIDLFDQCYAASETLRTIFNLKEYAPCSFNHVAAILSQCKRLRLLDLHGVAMETLPDTFDKLLHLRYLDLSNNEKLEKLPSSITKICGLQVLILHGCKNLQKLPENMRNLKKLRTLDIDGCNKLARIPAGINLACLHMFTMFVLCEYDFLHGYSRKLRCMIDLVNVKGNILIKEKDTFLIHKKGTNGTRVLQDAQVQVLEMICTDGSSDQGGVHETLLEIQGYEGTKLTKITLSHLGGLQHLTTLSQLQHLKNLHLQNLLNAASIDSNPLVELELRSTKSTIFFPSLEKLVLEQMLGLKGWWRDLTWMEMEGGGCLVNSNGCCMEQFILPTFPRLQDLTIRLCPLMTYFPPCPLLKRLELNGVDEAFCMMGSALVNPVASVSCNSRDPNLCLEKLVVCYNSRVFDSLFGKSIVSSAADIDIKYFHQEEGLQVTREAFKKCSSSLRHLSIDGFYKLRSLSGGGIEHLTNLQSLSIKDCSKLDSEEFKMEGEEEGMTWKSLHSESFSKLVNLPKGFQYSTALQSLGFLSSLQSLHIEDCNNLKSLPECLCSLTSLQSIHVHKCKNLETLPDCLYPMSSLQILDVKNCPKILEC